MPLFRKEDMMIGCTGEQDVQILQLLLIALKFNCHIEPNGIYDERTEIGVKMFQHENGMEPSGVFDARTRVKFAKITKIDVNKIPDLLNPTGSAFASFNTKPTPTSWPAGAPL